MYLYIHMPYLSLSNEKNIPFEELSNCTRQCRGLKRRFKNQLKTSMTQARINPETTNRPSSVITIHWIEAFECNSQHEEDLCRDLCRARLSQPRPSPSHLCESLSRVFMSMLSLHSHPDTATMERRGMRA